MSEKLLSQTEIEALMSGLTLDTEEPPAAVAVAEPVQSQKSVKVYDFRRPDKFSKDHLRALRILHGTFARVLSSALTSYLRTNIQLRLTMVEQVTYEEDFLTVMALTRRIDALAEAGEVFRFGRNEMGQQNLHTWLDKLLAK